MTVSPARTPTFFMASEDMPNFDRFLPEPSNKVLASDSSTRAILAMVFFPRFPLMETVSPSNKPISSKASTVIHTTEWPSSLSYEKTSRALRPDEPPRMAIERSSALSFTSVVIFFDCESPLVVFFFFFFLGFDTSASSSLSSSPMAIIQYFSIKNNN